MVTYPEVFVLGLAKDNLWWTGGKPDAPPFHRSDYQHFVEDIGQAGVHLVIGPRRVGKSKMLFQMIQHVLNQGVPPRRIIYISLERTYLDILPNKLLDTITYYETHIASEKVGANGRTYLFVDEAQYDPSWARLFKEYVDQQRDMIAYVSGSSSAALFKGSAESGAGRFHTHFVMTMKFRDALRLRKIANADQIRSISHTLRAALLKSLKEGKPSYYIRTAVTAAQELSQYAPDAVLDEYLLKGGYPEFYFKDSWPDISTYYRDDVFGKILQNDVVNVFNIRNPDKVKSLLVQLLYKTASHIERDKLAQLINVKSGRGMLDQYIEALSKAYLIRAALKYRKQPGRPSTKAKKFFAADPGMRNAVLGIERPSQEERGALLETIVFNHILRLEFHIDRQVRELGFFYSGEYERDIIIQSNKLPAVVPVEVKLGQADTHDAAKVRHTCNALKAPLGILVGGDTIGEINGIIRVPAWLFLLSC